MKIKHKGIEINLEFDPDGYPTVSIQTDGYTAEYDRPAVEVKLNGVEIHDMFDGTDRRWQPREPRNANEELIAEHGQFDQGDETS